MPLPDNFSPAEHLQDLISNIQNKIVRAEFSDVGDDNWVRDISTPRGSLRVACTHQEADSLAMCQLRLDLFYLVLKKAKDFHPNIYGIPSGDFQEIAKFYPQVQLYFEEKFSEAERGYSQLRTQVSFRLTNETSQTFTIGEALNLANRIKALFNVGDNPFFFKRGKELATYVDQAKGYYFQLYIFDETNAKKIIEQVLDIRNNTPDWSLLKVSKNSNPAAAYPTIPPTKNILAKSIRQPRQRPVGTVRFTSAIVHLYGRLEPLVLYDPDKRYPTSLVR
jgi:hypothetical protein